MTTERRTAYLRCGECGQDCEHEITYAGRLLFSCRCTACGHESRHDDDDFTARYVTDLEHRLWTKPQRLARRARRHPVAFVRTLPTAIARQPGKFLGEARLVLSDLLRRDERPPEA